MKYKNNIRQAMDNIKFVDNNIQFIGKIWGIKKHLSN